MKDEDIIDKALQGAGIPVDIRVNLLLCRNALKIQRDEIEKELFKFRDNTFGSEESRINEFDLQNGLIEFSMTGELYPVEILEGNFKELMNSIFNRSPEVKLGNSVSNGSLNTPDKWTKQETTTINGCGRAEYFGNDKISETRVCGKDGWLCDDCSKIIYEDVLGIPWERNNSPSTSNRSPSENNLSDKVSEKNTFSDYSKTDNNQSHQSGSKTIDSVEKCTDQMESSGSDTKVKDRRQPGMEEGEYTTGALCECRHSYNQHPDGECLKCDCNEFRYMKDWRKK